MLILRAMPMMPMHIGVVGIVEKEKEKEARAARERVAEGEEQVGKEVVVTVDLTKVVGIVVRWVIDQWTARVRPYVTNATQRDTRLRSVPKIKGGREEGHL